MDEVFLGLGGAALTWGIYRAIEIQWPFSYFGVDDLLSQRVSVSATRYALFRFSPVLLISAAIAVVAAEIDANATVAAVLSSTIHAFMTHGQAARWVLQRRDRFARRIAMILHAGLLAAVASTGYLGAIVGRTSWFPHLVPDVADLPGDLWSALLAAAFTAAYLKATRGADVTETNLLEHARRGVDSSTLQLARDLAVQARTDPDLVEAVLLVENLQRPKWVRRIERILGPIAGVRTYGIMQVTSGSKVDDAESIEIAIRDHLNGVQIPDTEYGYNSEKLEDAIRSYNANADFVRFAASFYDSLRSGG